MKIRAHITRDEIIHITMDNTMDDTIGEGIYSKVNDTNIVYNGKLTVNEFKKHCNDIFKGDNGKRYVFPITVNINDFILI